MNLNDEERRKVTALFSFLWSFFWILSLLWFFLVLSGNE